MPKGKNSGIMKRYFFLFLSIFLMTGVPTGCKIKGGQGINLFSIEQEKELGLQVKQEIESNPSEFPILPEQGHEEIYAYIRSLRDRLLGSGQVAHRQDFAWEVKIIQDDETLNAFCTPGGYIYVYSGLIKFLDSESELLGVLGHEMAHAALRHSTRQLTKIYGLQVLVAIATGKSEPGLVEQIALGLVSLKFSRSHEAEADAHSVLYLCNSPYDAAGAAGFFEKMLDRPNPPEFLSTHPSPDHRVEDIHAKKQELGCPGTKKGEKKYAEMKKLL